MPRTLPMYIDCAEVISVLPGSEPATATRIVDSSGMGCAGALIVGAHGTLDSAVGRVTVSIYDGADVATARQYYSVELDFSTEVQTSDLMEGVPAMKEPHVTLTGDAPATGKTFTLLPYLKKISAGN